MADVQIINDHSEPLQVTVSRGVIPVDANGLAAYGRLLAYESVTSDLLHDFLAEVERACLAREALDRAAFTTILHGMSMIRRLAIVTMGKASVWAETAALSGYDSEATRLMGVIRENESEISDAMNVALAAIDITPWKN